MSPTISTLISGGTSSPRPTGQTDHLIRVAHVVLDNVGHAMSPSKVSRLVRRFEYQVAGNGWSFFDYLANSIALDAEQRRRALADPEVARVIAYADTTGETAVRNVMRGER